MAQPVRLKKLKLNGSMKTYHALLDIITKENTIYSNEKVYGEIEYVIETLDSLYTSNSYNFKIDFSSLSSFEITCYTRYKNAIEITSNKYNINLLGIY